MCNKQNMHLKVTAKSNSLLKKTHQEKWWWVVRGTEGDGNLNASFLATQFDREIDSTMRFTKRPRFIIFTELNILCYTTIYVNLTSPIVNSG
jgi:hypothetical protein